MEKTLEHYVDVSPSHFANSHYAISTAQICQQLETLLQQSSFTRLQQLLTLLAISITTDENLYASVCTTIAAPPQLHSRSLIELIENKRISDYRDRVLTTTVFAIIQNRGWLPQPELSHFLSAGFRQKHYLDLMLIVTTKNLSHYIKAR